jgi:putative transposase
MQQALVRDWGLSIRTSCRLTGISRSHLNQPRLIEEDALRAEIQRLAHKYPRFGYRRIHTLLERLGWKINVKRVRRIWTEEGLQVKKKRRRRRKGSGVTVLVPEQAKAPNHVWTLDFVQDRLHKGPSIRLLTVLDEFTVRLTLEVLFKDYGIPMYLRSDNGSEFIARCLQGWLETQGTQPLFIEPGSPWQNGKCESFNGRLRDECLNLEWFDSLKEAQVVIEAWRDHYNQERPHSALNYLAPRQFIQQWQQEQSILRKSA